MKKIHVLGGIALMLAACSLIREYLETQDHVVDTTYCDGTTPKPAQRPILPLGAEETTTVTVTRSEKVYKGMDYAFHVWGEGRGLLDLEIGQTVFVVANERDAQRKGCPVFNLATETSNGESPLAINPRGTSSGAPMISADRTNAGVLQDIFTEMGCLALTAGNPTPEHPSRRAKIEEWMRNVLSFPLAPR